jgi:putative membrane protein
MKLIVRFLLTLAAIFLANELDLGVHAESTKALILASIVLTLFNTVLTPIMALIAAPLIVLTFGLFLIVPPAISVLITANIVPGFSVASFWSAALLTLLLFGLTVLTGGAKVSVKTTRS